MTDASTGRQPRQPCPGRPTRARRRDRQARLTGPIPQPRLARPIRVMQTFGEPRDTTNPYLVMLRAALIEEPSVEHIPFSWRTALTGRYDVLHVHWPDALLAGRHWWTRAGKRVAFAGLIARVRLRRIAVVRTVHNVTPPSGPRLDRALIRALDAAHGCPNPYRRPDPRCRRCPLGADPARALPNLVRADAAGRDGSRTARVRGPDQAVQGGRAPGRRVCRGIRHRPDAHAPDLGQAGGRGDRAPAARRDRAARRARDDAAVRRRSGVRRGGDVERTRRAALPVHAQLGNRPGCALPRAPHPRARQRGQSRTLVGSGPGLGATVRWRPHGRRTARRHADPAGRPARGCSRPQRSGLG